MSSGLEARMIATKVESGNYGEKVAADRWFVVHAASNRAISPRHYANSTEAETVIASIYAAIPEADWTMPIADLVKIPDLQTRILKA